MITASVMKGLRNKVRLRYFAQGKCSVSVYATLLIIALKDHKAAEVIALSRESNKSMVREKTYQQGFDINNVVEVRKGEDYSYKPALLTITIATDVKKNLNF